MKILVPVPINTSSLFSFVLSLWAFYASAEQPHEKISTESVSKLLRNKQTNESSSSPRNLQAKCISPKSLRDSSSSTITTGKVIETLRSLQYLFLPMANDFIESLISTYETPIQFRQVLYHGTNCYNVAAMYHPTALDIWGNGDKRICINEFATENEFIAHEQVASAYAFAYSSVTFSPSSRKNITNIMENVLGLPMSYLYGTPDLGTPWGLAKYMVDQMFEYSETDGWNANGTLANEFNRMPFRDFDYKEYSSYKPKRNNVDRNKESNCKKEWFWEPLLETDYVGYFTKQEHVTPYAGFTGRLYGMTKFEYESFSISKPTYDYCEEAGNVLEETMNMAQSDKKKMEIELFDSKFTSLLPMQINWSLMNQFSSFKFWYYDMTIVTAMYDATLLVWREKVAIDAVRPTTVVHTLKKDFYVKSYAGPNNGVRKMNATDWQPYIRTMPHAEFPSGSSCICTAFAETLQLLTGMDKTGEFPITMQVKAGSSKTEPGIIPHTDLNFTYTSWSEIQHVCGQSRINGGMHFSKAIPAGEELCSGVANLVVKRAEQLKSGDAKGAFANLNDISIIVKKSSNNNKQEPPPECVDSKTWKIKLSDGSKRGCFWISKYASLRCQKSGAKQNCPVSCKACNTNGKK